MRLRKLYRKTSTGLVPSGKLKIINAANTQRFTPKFVERGVAENWLVMGNGRITLHGEKGDIFYKIVRTPGRYPIKQAPGYEIIHFYDTVKEN